jgi:hypothetical protein
MSNPELNSNILRVEYSLYSETTVSDLNSKSRVEYSACVSVTTARARMNGMVYDALIAWLNVNVGDWQESHTVARWEMLFYLHSVRHAHLMAIAMSAVVLQVYTKDGEGTWT